VKLQLPPQRTLADPDGHVDRILRDARSARSKPRTRARVLGLVVAAATVLIAVPIGVTALRPDPAQVGGPPYVTATPQPPPTAHPTASGPPVAVRVGSAVTFPRLVVTLSSAGQLSVNTVAIDEYTITVTTCVRKSSSANAEPVRLDEDSWTVNTSSGTITTKHPIRTPVPLPATYPATGSYRAGRCVSGVIPFGVNRADPVRSIQYSNAFGDHASWRP
jgi:hypothetical protein